MQQSNIQMQYYALLNGQKFLYPMAIMEWYSCRQFMEDEMLVRIEGGSEYAQFLRQTYPDGSFAVSRDDFDAAFDCEVKDGSQPQQQNPAPLAQVLSTYLGGQGVIDQVVASRGGVQFIDRLENALMDSYGVKEWPALLGGGGVQAQVLPDQQVQDLQSQGKLVDFGQASQMMRNGG
jgi:hypothetical protein